MDDFRFADWNPKRSTVPAYLVGSDGLVTLGDVIVIDGAPCNAAGEPLADDGETQALTGWRHSLCQSFERGRVLIPLKGSRQ